jgi:hypothetical protein
MFVETDAVIDPAPGKVEAGKIRSFDSSIYYVFGSRIIFDLRISRSIIQKAKRRNESMLLPCSA